jgi:hypothetical protein
MGGEKGQKHRLKPPSYYGLDPRDLIRTFVQIDSKGLKGLEERENEGRVAERSFVAALPV